MLEFHIYFEDHGNSVYRSLSCHIYVYSNSVCVWMYLLISHSGTFFVEYHFPAAVSGRGGRGRKGRVFPPPHEVVRVASRKIKKKGVAWLHKYSPSVYFHVYILTFCSHPVIPYPIMGRL